MKKQTNPLKFFSLLKWIDGRPLMEVIEPYRQKIFTETLFTLEAGNPRYNLALTGRAKKNWKSADLVLAALYRLLIWESPLGHQCYILANDEGQANDDLTLAKSLIKVNPILQSRLSIKVKTIERKDGEGFLQILPAGDVSGSHGKTYLFCGFDELHGHRDWGLLEAMQLDPHRPDAMIWITSYASLYNYPGIPLYDLTLQGKEGKEGKDPRFYFNWHAGDFCTDPEYQAKATPEERANPSTLPGDYLDQQRKRLPSHKYRRLHLNLPGSPEGAYLSPERVEEATREKYKRLPYKDGACYQAFVDMSGGSGDDATLSIAHRDEGRVIVDGVWNQGHRPPFDPRKAIDLFTSILKEYRLSQVTGDRYAGETFRVDFQSRGIAYQVCSVPKSSLYEVLEVELNSGRVSLPDEAQLIQQLLLLVIRAGKIDHPAGEHDDMANAAAGAVYLCHGGVSFNIEDLHELDSLVTTRWGSPFFRHEHEGSPWDDM